MSISEVDAQGDPCIAIIIIICMIRVLHSASSPVRSTVCCITGFCRIRSVPSNVCLGDDVYSNLVHTHTRRHVRLFWLRCYRKPGLLYAPTPPCLVLACGPSWYFHASWYLPDEACLSLQAARFKSPISTGLLELPAPSGVMPELQYPSDATLMGRIPTAGVFLPHQLGCYRTPLITLYPVVHHRYKKTVYDVHINRHSVCSKRVN
jgi:hypothetical protein